MKKTKKLLALLVMLVVTLWGIFPAATFANEVWDGTVANEFAGGDGTAAAPYEIATPQQLALMAQQANLNPGPANDWSKKFYKLTNDLDLGGHEWTPIGYKAGDTSYHFQGVFIGQGHTIRNLTISNSSNHAGLFGVLAGGVVCDFTLDQVNITTTSTSAGAVTGRLQGRAKICNVHVTGGQITAKEGAGGLVGWAEPDAGSTCSVLRSTVSNLTVKATYNEAGGLVGCNPANHGNVLIDGCGVYGGSVYSPCGLSGGILGGTGITITSTSGSATITNCFNSASVSSGQASYYATGTGGILGFNRHEKTVISNCWNKGSVTTKAGRSASDKSYAGGIVGSNQGGLIQSCLNEGVVSVSSSPASSTSTTSLGAVDARRTKTDSGCAYLDESLPNNKNASFASNNAIKLDRQAFNARLNSQLLEIKKYWKAGEDGLPALVGCCEGEDASCSCGCYCQPHQHKDPEHDCIDEDGNGFCDICTKCMHDHTEDGTCKVENCDHPDECCKKHECSDGDGDGRCDICNKCMHEHYEDGPCKGQCKDLNCQHPDDCCPKHVHVDEDENGKCDVCGKCVHPKYENGQCKIPDCDHTEECCPRHVVCFDEDNDGFCDVCGKCMHEHYENDSCKGQCKDPDCKHPDDCCPKHVHIDTDNDGYCDGCGICMHPKNENNNCTVEGCDHGDSCCNHTHVDDNKDGFCDDCTICMHEHDVYGNCVVEGCDHTALGFECCKHHHFDENGDGKCDGDGCLECLHPHDKNHNCTVEGCNHSDLGYDCCLHHHFDDDDDGFCDKPDCGVCMHEHDAHGNCTKEDCQHKDKDCCKHIHVDEDFNGICDICKKCIHEHDEYGNCTVEGCTHTNDGYNCCKHTHADPDGDGICNSCGACLHTPGDDGFCSTPGCNHQGGCCKHPHVHTDGNFDGICDTCGACLHEHDGNNNCTTPGCDHKGGCCDCHHIDTDKNGICDRCNACLHDKDENGNCTAEDCKHEGDCCKCHHIDMDGDSICDRCHACLHIHDENGNCTIPNCPHRDGEHDCCNCKYHIDSDNNGKCDICGTCLHEHDEFDHCTVEGCNHTDGCCSKGTTDTDFPKMEKTVFKTADKTADKTTDKATANAGESVTFTLTSNVPNYLYKWIDLSDNSYTSYPITIHDKMDSGLERTSEITLTINENTPGEAYYSVNTNPNDGCTFHIDLDLAKICVKDSCFSYDDIKNSPAIEASYQAKVSDDYSHGHLTNTSWVTFKKDKPAGAMLRTVSQDAATEFARADASVDVYAIQILKTESEQGRPLAGAKFQLYKDEACTKPFKDELVTDEKGLAMVGGLAGQTLYLKETEAPGNYVRSTEVTSLNLESRGENKDCLVTAERINSLAPNTGGTGIRLFVVGGSVLITAGALFELFDRRKKNRA